MIMECIFIYPCMWRKLKVSTTQVEAKVWVLEVPVSLFISALTGNGHKYVQKARQILALSSTRKYLHILEVLMIASLLSCELSVTEPQLWAYSAWMEAQQPSLATSQSPSGFTSASVLDWALKFTGNLLQGSLFSVARLSLCHAFSTGHLLLCQEQGSVKFCPAGVSLTTHITCHQMGK